MPPRGRKRKSESVASDYADAPEMSAAIGGGERIATKMDSAEESPRKRQKTGLTVGQKQALIDNLQLEVTERARKLRAQYSLQAQGLRTRIEIRVNRIPMALRKLKMGDLLAKHSGQQRPSAPEQTLGRAAAPPVPQKDAPAPMPRPVGRPKKIVSEQSADGDKENQTAHTDSPKKRQKAGTASATAPTQPAQVLSPTSSNSRLMTRERIAPTPGPQSPVKSYIARPMSPVKQSTAGNLLSSMVEKARATRTTATNRKVTTSSTASSAAPTASRVRSKVSATSAPAPAPASRSTAAAVSRTARRISGTSESSDASTSTVLRKVGRPVASAARKVTATNAAPSTKKTVMSSLKKSVASASTKKTAAKTAPAAATAAATTRSGRVLRKRD